MDPTITTSTSTTPAPTLSSSTSTTAAPSGCPAVNLDALMNSITETPKPQTFEGGNAIMATYQQIQNSKNLMLQNSSNLLSKQQAQLVDIINVENSRLDQKKTTVDNMQFEQERMIQMNRNIQERTAAFNRILIVFFISLGITIAIISLGRMVSLSESIVVILSVLVLGTGLSYCLYLYLSFRGRMEYDYNLLKIDPPSNTDTKSINVNGLGGDLFGQLNCIGPECCDGVNNMYDTDLNTCVPLRGNSISGNVVSGNARMSASISSFATLTDAYGFSDYISSQTEPENVMYPSYHSERVIPESSCQNPLAYPSQYAGPHY